MASKKRSKEDAGAATTPHLQAHLTTLGLPSLEAYRTWCRANGFSARLDKGPAALHREAEEASLRVAREKHAKRRRLRDPLAAMQLAMQGELEPDEIGHREVTLACTALARAKVRDQPGLLELLRTCRDRGDFLLDSEVVGGRPVPMVRALLRLHERRGGWLRALDTWRPDTHNRRRQFASLLRHLLANYPVPTFLDSVWWRDDKGSHALRDLFVHVGMGGNPRTTKLPISMSKKVAHHFLQAPDHCSFEAAVRWGQVHAAGGSARLAEAVAGSPIGASFVADEFWQSVIAFFIANPLLDVAQFGPVVDYITHQKFRSVEAVRPDGSIRTVPPPHPGFSMARRTPDSLLRQMERWHTAVGKASSGRDEVWPSSGIPPFCWSTGQRNTRTWTISELRSRRALELESRTLGHCVASYAGSCRTGRCSIWTLETTMRSEHEKRLTIEVSKQRVIVQCRGKWNRMPEPQEQDVLRRWADAAGLTLGVYL